MAFLCNVLASVTTITAIIEKFVHSAQMAHTMQSEKTTKNNILHWPKGQRRWLRWRE